MKNPIKHNKYKDWKISNIREKPVLCGERCYYVKDYDTDFIEIDKKIREYMKNEFGLNNFILDVAYPESNYLKLKNGYKPNNVYLIINIVFKTETKIFKQMLNCYNYVFDEIDKKLMEYEKTKETKIL